MKKFVAVLVLCSILSNLPLHAVPQEEISTSEGVDILKVFGGTALALVGQAHITKAEEHSKSNLPRDNDGKKRFGEACLKLGKALCDDGHDRLKEAGRLPKNS